MARFVCLAVANQQTERAIAALRRLPYRQYLRTHHWKRVRVLALERAGYACALCPGTERLEVHHRDYRRRGFEQAEDLVVLCDECHGRHHRAIALAAVGRPEPAKAPLVPAGSNRWLKGA